MSEQSAYNFLYLFQRKKGDDHPTIPCNYLYQQVKGLKKHEKDIQDPDSATREFLEAQEKKEKRPTAYLQHILPDSGNRKELSAAGSKSVNYILSIPILSKQEQIARIQTLC